MLRLFRLTARPLERFLTQWLSVSTHPSAFVRERVRLGDTTNFLRAIGFFASAVSTAFLAEIATLYVLDIGGLTEPYYWVFVLLTAIPFVLFCFLLVRFVTPLSFRDVLHLSFYPIGAGLFTGAAFALAASAVVGMLAAVGYIPDIKYDLVNFDTGPRNIELALRDCLASESLTYTILAAGLQAAYSNLKPPIDGLSYLRPVIGLLYLVIAAFFFMAAVVRRKAAVFSMVLLAAVLSTSATFFFLKKYFEWNLEHSSCGQRAASGELGFDRVAESVLKKLARDLNASGLEASSKDSLPWNISVHSDGRTLIWNYRLKGALSVEVFNGAVSQQQKMALERYCSASGSLLRSAKTMETHTYYSSEGERLTGFSVGPSDCAQW